MSTSAPSHAVTRVVRQAHYKRRAIWIMVNTRDALGQSVFGSIQMALKWFKRDQVRFRLGPTIYDSSNPWISWTTVFLSINGRTEMFSFTYSKIGDMGSS